MRRKRGIDEKKINLIFILGIALLIIGIALGYFYGNGITGEVIHVSETGSLIIETGTGQAGENILVPVTVSSSANVVNFQFSAESQFSCIFIPENIIDGWTVTTAGDLTVVAVAPYSSIGISGQNTVGHLSCFIPQETNTGDYPIYNSNAVIGAKNGDSYPLQTTAEDGLLTIIGESGDFIKLGSVSGKAGDYIEVPVIISSLEGVINFQFTEYNTLMSFTFNKEQIINDWTATTAGDLTVVSVAPSSSLGITGENIVGYLAGTIPASASEGNYALDIQNVGLGKKNPDGSSSQIPAYGIDGQVEVTTSPGPSNGGDEGSRGGPGGRTVTSAVGIAPIVPEILEQRQKPVVRLTIPESSLEQICPKGDELILDIENIGVPVSNVGIEISLDTEELPETQPYFRKKVAKGWYNQDNGLFITGAVPSASEMFDTRLLETSKSFDTIGEKQKIQAGFGISPSVIGVDAELKVTITRDGEMLDEQADIIEIPNPDAAVIAEQDGYDIRLFTYVSQNSDVEVAFNALGEKARGPGFIGLFDSLLMKTSHSRFVDLQEDLNPGLYGQQFSKTIEIEEITGNVINSETNARIDSVECLDGVCKFPYSYLKELCSREQIFGLS